MQKPRTATAKQLFALVEQQQYLCALSGRELTPETASLDHIIPLARGGTHDLDNLWVLDHRINIAKGTLLVSEFVDMCREIACYQRVLGTENSSENAAGNSRNSRESFYLSSELKDHDRSRVASAAKA